MQQDMQKHITVLPVVRNCYNILRDVLFIYCMMSQENMTLLHYEITFKDRNAHYSILRDGNKHLSKIIKSFFI